MGRTGQRIVVYRPTERARPQVWTTVYGDEQEAMRQVALCRVEHPDAVDLAVLNADAFPPDKLRQA